MEPSHRLMRVRNLEKSFLATPAALAELTGELVITDTDGKAVLILRVGIHRHRLGQPVEPADVCIGNSASNPASN